jgi:tripartite-type tricarboxylate transporter receptor subunit TctC
MSAPSRTPPDLINRLNRDIVEILRARTTRDWMLAQGAEPLPTTPEEYAEFLRGEIAKWTKVIEVSGARVD